MSTVTPIDTCATTLYGIMDRNDCLITVKGKPLYLTRKDAREARRSLERKDVRIVKCDFTNYTQWITAK